MIFGFSCTPKLRGSTSFPDRKKLRLVIFLGQFGKINISKMYIITDILHFLIVSIIDAYQFLEKRVIIYAEKYVEKRLHRIFKKAGITLNGPNKCDPQIKNKKEFYTRVVSNATLGLGECYMEGHWDCEDIEDFIYKVLFNNLSRKYLGPVNRITNYLLFHTVNLQTGKKAWEVGEKHYDLGNELFESFLDPAMNYSCGYWKNADNLEQAQINKMELIGKKLKLKPGMKVLDIGCGFGGLCKFLAENFGVEMVGCTISVEQGNIARQRCADLPVEILLSDYRDINEKFDRIVSVGMFEHVGTANYKEFFQVANRCLKDDGIFLLHTIGVSHQNTPLIEPWFNKYIFPNSCLPYHTDIPKNIDGLFILEDWHSFGPHYGKTLLAWRENFQRNWPQLSMKAGKNFYRMWNYYLSLSAGAFRARKYQVWQVVLTKNGLPGGYESVR